MSNTEKLLSAILQSTTQLHKEINSIKTDVDDIKTKIESIKKDNDNNFKKIMSAFPNGIDSHANEHKLKWWRKWI